MIYISFLNVKSNIQLNVNELNKFIDYLLINVEAMKQTIFKATERSEAEEC